jgi:IMP dehydrogenase
MERAEALIQAKVDVLIIDTAHGHSQRVLDTVKKLRAHFPGQELIAGNIGTAEAAEDLIALGVNAVKVGVGPGSICTTRVVTGAGVPQITAVADVYKAASPKGIPVIADGGIKFSGDVTKAIAAGASSVMLGNLLAATDESPGETVIYQGRSYKTYRGMGSIEAMKEGSRDRYFQDSPLSESKLVPEGIEGRVPYKGSTSRIIQMMVGGLKAGMGYAGCRNIEELQKKAKFIRITSAGLRESHVHDVMITKEAPNYQLD